MESPCQLLSRLFWSLTCFLQLEKVKMTATKPKQIERFKQAARELGCDENEAAFEDKLRRIAKPKRKPKAKDEDEAPE